MTYSYAFTVLAALVTAAFLRLVLAGINARNRRLSREEITVIFVVTVLVLLVPYASEISIPHVLETTIRKHETK